MFLFDIIVQEIQSEPHVKILESQIVIFSN